jgi:hypothetical protein
MTTCESQMICTDEQRRQAVRQNPHLNGLDYVEIIDEEMVRDRPVRLSLFFLDQAPRDLRPENIRITGGTRIRDLKVLDLEMCGRDDPELDDCLIVTLDRPGDLSGYRLCIVDLDKAGKPSERLHPAFDPRYACLDFDFQSNCPSDLDCEPGQVCLPEVLPEPEIDYLAKDYASFRQLILDRLAVVMPEWQERHVPDLGITLVELLAYTGDALSYYQDSVATEAYLDTARQRISVRRHARLVDYRLHEGCNARAWVCIRPQAEGSLELDPTDFYLVTHYETGPAAGSQILSEVDVESVPTSRYEAFEPLLDPPAAPWFTEADLKDSGCLAAKLTDAREAVSRFLWQAMPASLQEALQQPAPLPAAGLQALVDYLNATLENPDLYDKRRFENVELRPWTRSLATGDLSGDALFYLNRALLEDAYPQEIAFRRQAGEPLVFYHALNRISFYDWGYGNCCLPRGTTRATLRDAWEEQGKRAKRYDRKGSPQQQGPDKEPPESRPCDRLRRLRHLQPGQVLVLEEVLGPQTGNPADADPHHRHAVRIVRVEPGIDPLNGQPIVEIEWHAADALPFPLCISAPPGPPDCEPRCDVSVACGNVVLVDHGRRVENPDLGCVPVAATEEHCDEPCRQAEVVLRAGKYRPTLKEGPVVFYQPMGRASAPASSLLQQDPRRALPWIGLESWFDAHCLPGYEPPQAPEKPAPEEPEKGLPPGGQKQPEPSERPALEQKAMDPPASPGTGSQAVASARSAPEEKEEGVPTDRQTWQPRLDLFASQMWDAHFVAEIDNRRRAHLRFGDGELGLQPAAAHRFAATYRVGDGPRGNVGAGKIVHLVLRRQRLSGAQVEISNPLPARGGTAPEPLAEAKLMAPAAFRGDLARAVTADDYAAIVMRDFQDRVQRAAARLRWTGSWYEVLVVVDPLGSRESDPGLLAEIEAHLALFRRIGHDLRVEPARAVPLELHLEVCVEPDYLRGHVKAALLALLGNRRLPDGTLGFFHPDRLSFGEGLYLSEIVAAAQGVPGVESVDVLTLQRLSDPSREALDSGLLRFGPLEIGRLDNDPSFPEHGKLVLTMRGGR